MDERVTVPVVVGCVALTLTSCNGFAPLDLPEGEIDARVTLRHHDGTESLHTITVVPAVVHPNGERCGGAALQGTLVLDDGGLRCE